ncbi:CCA tRNA nucleotidyltransferase [Granulicella mallensis]|uniref:Polynucleotide adenylyltransferase region n=1 Tax=Granulicella mallensis (strain ATCC BAA-1857 / DSM 23137 / MP5ACTX8) TaxID=682795 RepID=G8NY64_GRAMM|nr:CCA tRNA nucleotidyltransferase [Granulicella mallensis]AEU36738.1 Polynucleotide adenylyltransferase region [Granulicella mallensis MP5ACTX8]
MADYIYLLQTRLTGAQQQALAKVRDVARAHGMTVFLVGGAVRDLTSGSPIRDLDVTVQGNALKLKKDLQHAGAVLVGESDLMQALYFTFPGGIRLEVGSTLSVTYPKPGKPVVHASTILDDLRRRDFTANAMAISLNEGSYGLLMDPLNGVADIDNRELRLVSNYGFIEDPARMIRAARFGARLGWHMEEKTQQRYDTGKAEGYISAMDSAERGYETEEIFHEEDPLRVLRRLESEGWNKFLFPAWTSAKANESELTRLRDTVGQLEAMGIHPDPSAAYFPLLTAKLAPKDVADLKASFARPGFVDQIAALEGETKNFATQFTSKAAAAPSDAWKMLMSAVPEQVLWLAHSTKTAAIQARFKAFFEEWPQARQRIPYQLMQEMRITPELPGYDDLIGELFFAIMDGKLDTPETARAYLEPYSPPAPPPPVNLRRRAVKKEAKVPKSRSKKVVAESEDSSDVESETATAAHKEPAVAPVKAKPVAAKAETAKPAVKAPEKKVVAGKKVEAKAAVKKAAPKPAPAKKAVKAPAKAVKAPAKAIKPKTVKAPAKKAVKAAPAKKAAPKKNLKPAPKPKAKVPAKAKPKAPAKKKAPAKARR